MSGNHLHAIPGNQNEKALWLALILTTVFLIVEATAGILTNSLALISDAAHMLTDSAALAVALLAIRVGKRPTTNLGRLGITALKYSRRRSTPFCCFWSQATSCMKPGSAFIIHRKFKRR